MAIASETTLVRRAGLWRHAAAESSRSTSATIPAWLRIALVVTIIIGAVFRFTDLDKKVYSHDETLTSLRTSGYLLSEYEHAVKGHLVTIAQLQTFQNGNAQRDIRSTIRTLAIDDPQHPPLYYVLERSWQSLFNGSIVGRRALGGLFGLLTLPALYWLCRELLPRNRIWPLVAVALFAISPFELQYTQQAREYTLWGLLTVISSALFVRALRTEDRRVWIGYALAITAGLYAHIFFLFVVLAQTLTLLALARERTRAWRPFLFAVAVAGAAYSPWVCDLFLSRRTVADTSTWFGASLPAAVYAYKWLFSVGTVFFDAEYVNLWFSVVLLPIAAFAAWSLVVTARSHTKLLAIFIPALVATSVLPLLLPDLLFHQSRGTATRYVLPAWIAVDLAVAYCISLGLSANGLRRQLAGTAAMALIALGAVSWLVSAGSASWWTASSDAPVIPLAQAIDQKTNSRILTDDPSMALQLSNYLRSGNRFDLATSQAAKFRNATGGGSVFLINPSPALRAALARDPDVRLKLVYEPPFTDSPMLHTPLMDSPVLHASTLFSALRKRLTAIHNGANGDLVIQLWSVTRSDVANAPKRLSRTAAPLAERRLQHS